MPFPRSRSGPTHLSCLANGDVVAAVLVVVVVAVEHGAQAGGGHLRLLGDPVPQHAPPLEPATQLRHAHAHAPRDGRELR